MASDAAAPAVPAPAPSKPAPPKRRGSYNCGRCGLPKKGHVCSVPGPASTAATTAGGGDKAGEEPAPQPQPQPQTKPRRALQFDDPAASSSASAPAASPAASAVVLDAVPLAVMAPPRPRPPPPQHASAGKRARVEVVDVEEEEEDGGVDDDDLPPWVEVGAGRRAPGEVLVEVLRRLSPRAVAAAAGVSRGWRDCARCVWRAAEQVRLNAAGVRPVAALMARCPALTRLVLGMKR